MIAPSIPSLIPLPPRQQAVREAQRGWLDENAETLEAALERLPTRLPQFEGFVLYIAYIESPGVPQIFGIETIEGKQTSDYYGYLCDMTPATALSAAWEALREGHWAEQEAAFQTWLEDSTDEALFEKSQADLDTRALEKALVHDLAAAYPWTSNEAWAWLEVGSSPEWKVELPSRRVLLSPA